MNLKDRSIAAVGLGYLGEPKRLCVPQGKPVVVDLEASYDCKALQARGFEVFRF